MEFYDNLHVKYSSSMVYYAFYHKNFPFHIKQLITSISFFLCSDWTVAGFESTIRRI